MDDARKAEIARAVEERLQRSGTDEELLRIVERRPGQALIYTKREGDIGERVGVIDVAKLLG